MVGLSFGGVPPWLVQILTAALGGFLAYILLNWLHSPHLTVANVARIPVVDSEDEDPQYSFRVTVANIGTRPAENCEGTIHLRVAEGGVSHSEPNERSVASDEGRSHR